MPHGDYLLQSIRCDHSDLVLSRKLMCELFYVRICGLALFCVHYLYIVIWESLALVVLHLVAVKYHYQMTVHISLIVRQDIHEFSSRGVYVVLRQFPKCIPRKYNVVAIHYNIVLAGLSALECSRCCYPSVGRPAAHKRPIPWLSVSGLTFIILSIYLILRCGSPEPSVQRHILILVISAKCPCKYLAEFLVRNGHIRYALSRSVHRNIRNIAIIRVAKLT